MKYILLILMSVTVSAAPWVFNAGEPIIASQINENFENIEDNFKAKGGSSCKSGTIQYGDICAETSYRQSKLYLDARIECNSEEMSLCPAFIFKFADQSDEPSFEFSDGAGDHIEEWTSTPCVPNGGVYHNASTCVVNGSNNIEPRNTTAAVAHFRCCYTLN